MRKIRLLILTLLLLTGGHFDITASTWLTTFVFVAAVVLPILFLGFVARIISPALAAISSAAIAGAAALLLVDEGQVERAVELYALASLEPYVANSRWFEDVAGREIGALGAALPPEVAAAAQERGSERDLWATVEELLAELNAHESGPPDH